MQFSRVHPLMSLPEFSLSLFFLAGLGNTQGSTGTQGSLSLYLSTKGNISAWSLASETNRRRAHHRWEERVMGSPLVFTPQQQIFPGWGDEEKFQARRCFGSHLWSSCRRSHAGLREYFGGRVVKVRGRKLMWSLREASFHHFWDYLAHWLILPDFLQRRAERA